MSLSGDPALTAVTVGASPFGLLAGALVNRVAGRFHWSAGARPADLMARGAPRSARRSSRWPPACSPA
ncbi:MULTISPECIES: hypothetical protein [unclassified Modestobacter]|uniref:hypothetical protein n=1 Tax=unclassified Modestobacter TaxID=2643866 RepID=UPI0022AA5BE8|nr:MULTISPECIES: hypothetical protein [unclassified Modestobacter]MCZ2824691.1 hypothetical protein [Modestobacter sp. VKM Ac-2981]MCZ2854806.1 hypothetical protein [Modestobacter sp. VKM Ac-2982]